jgi:threonine/homoserine/homoserine lactone efflux protein
MGVSQLFVIFGFSLVVALTGAVVPGPLFTYTIIKTLDTPRRGFLVGARVIGGHAILESALIVAILVGVSAFLNNPVVIKIIGAAGGAFLLYMGIGIVVDVSRKRLRAEMNGKTSSPALGISNPVVGGALVSMSNPYWWVWWATVGFGFMLQYRVSFANWPALLVFLAGHEMGDLAWYFTLSTLVSMGRNRLNDRTFGWILLGCGTLIIAFGVWLGLSVLMR